jgi:O-antigen ligase
LKFTGYDLPFRLQVRKRIVHSPGVAQKYSYEHVTATPGDCCDTPSSGNFGAPSVARMVTRKRAQGRVVNSWMILIVFLGIVIASADGLTRALNLELELAPPQPLEYEPYRAGFLLAGVTLPLMFAYARRARVPLAEALFLWFVFCTTAYMKDFSYLRLPGTPLFVTDVVLMILVVACFLPHRRSSSPPVALNILLALFVTAGALAAVRGFLGHGEPKLVLRDSALVGYSLFLLVGYQLLRSWLAIKRAAIWFLLGTALSILNGLCWFVVAPEQRRFVFPGIYVLVSLIGVLVMMVKRWIRPRVGWPLAIFFSLGLLLANMRSLFVALAVVSLLALARLGLFRGSIRSARLATAVAAATTLMCLFFFLFFHFQAGRNLTLRVANNLASGVLHSSDDATWQFRRMAWDEAWKRFRECPSAGEGFGVPFNFDIWDNDPRPHNTFLTVLYKMGLVGFLPLFALLCYFFCVSLRAVHRNAKNRHISFLQALLLAQAAFCVFGTANFVFESPYVASLFWAGLGVGFHMITKFDVEHLLRGFVNRRGMQSAFGKFSTQGAAQ